MFWLPQMPFLIHKRGVGSEVRLRVAPRQIVAIRHETIEKREREPRVLTRGQYNQSTLRVTVNRVVEIQVGDCGTQFLRNLREKN